MASRSSRYKAKPRGILKSSTRRAKPFPFFTLPRELRNVIYQHSLLYEETWGPRTHGLEIRVVGAPITNLLLVNHQFGEEYRESVKRNTELTFVDVGRDSSVGPSSKKWQALPTTLRSIAHAHFAFWLLCRYKHKAHKEDKCVAAANLREHLDSIEPLLSQILSVGSSTVTLYFDSESRRPKWCLKAVQKEEDRLTSLPALTRVRLAKADADWMQGGPETAVLFLELEKKTGSLRIVDKKKAAKKLDAIEVPVRHCEGSDYSDDGFSDYSGRSRFSDYSTRSRLSSYSAGSRLSSHSTGSRFSDYSGSRSSDFSGIDLSDSSEGGLGSSSEDELSNSSEGGLGDYSGSEAEWSDSEDESVHSNDGLGENGSTGSKALDNRSVGEGAARTQTWVARVQERFLEGRKTTQGQKLI